ncbi:hypothetical protein NB693_20630 [Pantoea ananatis]|uniref:hypothetical protein n=1 Tax=Pantoea ananas TaxID=553 RepID=UPI002220DB7F|nr:hypothetical protein [Pantoea ananatis]
MAKLYFYYSAMNAGKTTTLLPHTTPRRQRRGQPAGNRLPVSRPEFKKIMRGEGRIDPLQIALPL